MNTEHPDRSGPAIVAAIDQVRAELAELAARPVPPGGPTAAEIVERMRANGLVDPESDAEHETGPDRAR